MVSSVQMRQQDLKKECIKEQQLKEENVKGAAAVEEQELK